MTACLPFSAQQTKPLLHRPRGSSPLLSSIMLFCLNQGGCSSITDGRALLCMRCPAQKKSSCQGVWICMAALDVAVHYSNAEEREPRSFSIMTLASGHRVRSDEHISR